MTCKSPTHAKRALVFSDEEEDPLRYLSWREDSARARVSPHLLADFLLNNFQVEHRGHAFTAPEMQVGNAVGWERALRKGAGKLAKFAGPKVIGKVIENVGCFHSLWSKQLISQTASRPINLGKSIFLSVTASSFIWMILWVVCPLACCSPAKDSINTQPYMLAALTEHPKWTGSVEIEGSEWDRDTFLAIVSSHRNWNATLHDPWFAKEPSPL